MKRARRSWRRERRRIQTVGPGRLDGHDLDKVAPGLAFGWGHELPTLGVLQELLAIFGTHARELLEGAQALPALRGSQISKVAQRFFDLPPLRLGERLEELLLFLRIEVEEFIKAFFHLAALRFGQVPPPGNSVLKFL